MKSYKIKDMLNRAENEHGNLININPDPDDLITSKVIKSLDKLGYHTNFVPKKIIDTVLNKREDIIVLNGDEESLRICHQVLNRDGIKYLSETYKQDDPQVDLAGLVELEVREVFP